MITITPAILTDNKDKFKELIKKLKDFKEIDIDIIREPFVEGQTLQLKDILENLQNLKSYSIGLHFMVEDPISDIKFLIKEGFDNIPLRIFLHQESDLEFLNDIKIPKKWVLGAAVKLDSQLRSINFYNKFTEIQFMSVEAGAQGNKFDDRSLEKTDLLRELGYEGKISLDGGINLNTAKFIKDFDISRVSVGSFLCDSDNPALAKMKLDLALNMKVEEDLNEYQVI